MKNLILVFSILFLSSFTIGNSEINSNLSNSANELIVQEDNFITPCEYLSIAVEVAIKELFEEHPDGDAIGAAAGISVYNECCKVFPSAC